MQFLSNKIRIVYLPFLAISVGCLVGYSFLNWLLLIKLQLFTLNDELVNIWLPFGFSGLLIVICLGPRLKALRAKKPRGVDPRGAFWFVAWIAVAAPTIIGQLYLETATGKLTHLEQIGQIGKAPITKYYTVQDAFFDKADASVEKTGDYSGRYNESFNMSVYLVCPIEDYGDASSGNIWFGTLYTGQISGHLPDDEKESRFHDFYNSSLAAYGDLDLRKFTYLEKLGLSDEDRAFEMAAKRSKLYRPGVPNIVLTAHSENFSDRNGNKLTWILASFGIGAVASFLILLVAPVDPKEMQRILSGEKPEHKVPDFIRLVFVPKRVAFVTPILIDVNIVVFIWMALAGLGIVSFNSSDLLVWGANFRPAVLNGEIWRLAVSMFVHGGLMHLFGNLVMLFLVGVMLETKLGSWRFAICYLICGIAGSIASVVWHPATVSVGASGAIMGMLGVLIGISLIAKQKNPKEKNGLLKLAFFILGYNLLMGAFMGGIDNAAHVGGLCCGLIFGVVFGVFPGLMGKNRATSKIRMAASTEYR